MTLFLPFIIGAVMILFYGLSKVDRIIPGKLKVRMQNVHVGWLLWRSYNSFLTTAHTFISWRIFGAFLWDDVDGVKRLQEFFEIEYDSSRGRAQLAVACLMCIVFTAGYPLFLLYHLYKTEWGRNITGPGGIKVNHVLGNLVDDFEPTRRHLVLADMTIRLIQVIILRFGQTVALQTIFFTLFLVIYFFLQLFFSPYRVELADPQRDANRRHVSVSLGDHVRNQGYRISVSDLSLCRYLYFRLITMQLKEQASSWMFILALMVVILGLISLGVDDSVAAGVFTLIVIIGMICITFLFAIRAFRARKKKDHLEDTALEEKKQETADATEEPLEDNIINRIEREASISRSEKSFASSASVLPRQMSMSQSSIVIPEETVQSS